MRTCENATCTRRQSRATHTMASGVHLCDDCYITSLHERVISLEQLIVDLQREMFPRGYGCSPPEHAFSFDD